MARVTGPLLSLDASGTVYDTLTYAKWKERNYVRQWFKPANPQSAGQVAQRAVFAAGVADWQSQTAETQADWDEAARVFYISGFNYFVQQYIKQGGTPVIP